MLAGAFSGVDKVLHPKGYEALAADSVFAVISEYLLSFVFNMIAITFVLSVLVDQFEVIRKAHQQLIASNSAPLVRYFQIANCHNSAGAVLCKDSPYSFLSLWHSNAELTAVCSSLFYTISWSLLITLLINFFMQGPSAVEVICGNGKPAHAVVKKVAVAIQKRQRSWSQRMSLKLRARHSRIAWWHLLMTPVRAALRSKPYRWTADFIATVLHILTSLRRLHQHRKRNTIGPMGDAKSVFAMPTREWNGDHHGSQDSLIGVLERSVVLALAFQDGVNVQDEEDEQQVWRYRSIVEPHRDRTPWQLIQDFVTTRCEHIFCGQRPYRAS